MSRKNKRDRQQSEVVSPAEEAFYGLAGSIVRAIEPHTESSAAALLIQFLVAFGFLVGRCAYYVADGARHYPNLFCVVVGATAKSRKGTSWGRVREVLAAVPGWPSDRVMNGLSSGEGLIAQLSEPPQDKRLLIVQTEFSAVLKVMARAGNTLSPVLRDAWDGNDLRIIVKNNPTSAAGGHVCVIGHITCGELKLQIDEVDLWNGFANRFLWCSATRARLLPHGGAPDESVLKPLLQRLIRAVKWANGLKGKRISWERSAVVEWECAYSALAVVAPGLVGAVTSRGEAQVVRLALIYALLDQSSEIRVEHLRAAVAVWKFCESSVHDVFAESTGDPVANRIRAALTASDGGMTRTQISELFKRHRSTTDIGRALDLLKDLGFAECRSEQGPGRSAHRWFAKLK